MELYIVKERRKGIARYDDVLRKLWDHDIVTDEQVPLGKLSVVCSIFC